jgi:hypothetical protein
MSAKQWLNGILTGESFPDLKKMREAKGIEDLVKQVKPGDSIYQAANDEKKRLEKQYRGDFRAAVASHGEAIEAGNANSCADKKQFGGAATAQQKYTNANTRQVTLPSYGARRVAPRKLPKNRGAAPVKDSTGRIRLRRSSHRNWLGGTIFADMWRLRLAFKAKLSIGRSGIPTTGHRCMVTTS